MMLGKLLAKVDKTWTALTLIAGIFVAGGVATLDYMELRDTVRALDIREAGREYFRLQAKIKAGTADQIDMLDWCRAAAKIGAGCEMTAPPAAGLIKNAWAGGGYRKTPYRDYEWFQVHLYRYRSWQKTTGGHGWYLMSLNRQEDQAMKRRWCGIGRAAWSRRMSQFNLPHYMRRPWRCPLEKYIIK